MLPLANESMLYQCKPLFRRHPNDALHLCKSHKLKIDFKRVTALNHIASVTLFSFLHVLLGSILKQTNTTRPRKVQHKAYGTWHKPKYLSVSQKLLASVVFSLTFFFIFTVTYKYLKSNVNHEDVAAIKLGARPCFTHDCEGNKEATTSALPTTRTTLLVADLGHAFRTPCKQQDKVQRLEALRL